MKVLLIQNQTACRNFPGRAAHLKTSVTITGDSIIVETESLSDLRKPSQVSQVSQSLIEGLLVPVWEGREPPGNRAMLIAAFLFSHFDRYSILYVAPNAYAHTLVRLCACCLPSYGELVPLHTHPHNRMKAMKPSLWRSDPTITLIYLVSYNGSE